MEIQNQQENQNNEEVVYKEQGSNLLTTDKKGIKQMADMLLKRVNDGEYDFLKAVVFATKLTALGKAINDLIKPIAYEKNKLSGKEIYSIYDCNIQRKDVGVKFDYTVCGDSVWDDLNAEFEKVKQLKEQREAFLSAITKPTTLIDEETGDVYEVKPPVRSATNGLTFTLK